MFSVWEKPLLAIGKIEENKEIVKQKCKEWTKRSFFQTQPQVIRIDCEIKCGNSLNQRCLVAHAKNFGGPEEKNARDGSVSVALSEAKTEWE